MGVAWIYCSGMAVCAPHHMMGKLTLIDITVVFNSDGRAQWAVAESLTQKGVHPSLSLSNGSTASELMHSPVGNCSSWYLDAFTLLDSSFQPVQGLGFYRTVPSK